MIVCVKACIICSLELIWLMFTIWFLWAPWFLGYGIPSPFRVTKVVESLLTHTSDITFERLLNLVLSFVFHVGRLSSLRTFSMVVVNARNERVLLVVIYFPRLEIILIYSFLMLSHISVHLLCFFHVLLYIKIFLIPTHLLLLVHINALID